MSAAPAIPPLPDRAVSVVLPTYNEAANIVQLITEILAQVEGAGWRAEVVVVDDDSPDNTAALVRQAFAGRDEVRVIVRQGERGLATAIRRGVAEASQPVVALMDTDFNHHPRYLPALLGAMAGCHIAVGSRYVPGGGMNTSRLRYLCSQAFNIWVRLILGVRTRDNLSGYIVTRAETLRSFDPDQVFYGYGDYAIRLLFMAQRRGLVIHELPVVYEERLGGESKTRFVHHLIEYTKSALALRRGAGR